MIAALGTLMSAVCLIYHGTQRAPDELGAALTAEQRATIRWRPASELLAKTPTADAPAVLIADSALLREHDELRAVPQHVVIVAADAAAATTLGRRADLVIADVRDGAARASLIESACRLAALRLEAAALEHKLVRGDDEFRELCRVVTALMHERDRTALLTLIVRFGKSIVESDGGGVLLLENDAQAGARLRPFVFELDSLPGLRLPTVSFPVGNKSMVGYAAFSREPVVVADAEALPPDAAFEANADFERRYGYPARSMMAVPMLTQRDEVLGVVFFINRKTDPRVSIMAHEDADRYVVPFSDRHLRLARSLASMAAVAIENARLYVEIEHILESLVKAAVSAIDARDPTTAGHSVRVATLTTGLAEAVQRAGRGAYRDLRFSHEQMRELRFAALLHDFGKVAVREDVLTKAKKLPPVLWERVESRFRLIHLTLERDYFKRRAGECGPGAGECPDPTRSPAELAEQLRDVDRQLELVRAANEPSMLATPQNTALIEIAKRTFQADDGRCAPYLTPDELRYLQLAQGTLDDKERAEVESHVEKTAMFLEQIPWTNDLKDLVVYASGHHEKLNGTGYPNHLRSEEIPVQTRMITLADMFDALTANDRPYKPAMDAERALAILRAEADAGLLDRDLVEIMTESQVYRTILDEDWRSF
jgi:HD-GYP domain-containing protein (c-di-GMP phosphodiesterase class II)